MHRDGRYGPCRSLSPPIVKQNDYRGWERRCQVWLLRIAELNREAEPYLDRKIRLTDLLTLDYSPTRLHLTGLVFSLSSHESLDPLKSRVNPGNPEEF